MTYSKKEELPLLISKLTTGPRNIFGLPIPQIKEGEPANLCVFDPDKSWTYLKDNILSKSSNSPFINKEFKGKVLATIHNNKLYTNL
jgi:dihydroorotase